MLNLKLKLEVKGVEQKTNKDNEVYTQLQTFIKNDKGAFVITTVKVLKAMSEKEMEDLIDSNVEITNSKHNLEEYYFEYGKMGYKCDNFDIIKEDLDESLVVERTLEIKVNSIIPMLDKDNKLKKVKLQSMTKIGTGLKLIEVSVKDIPLIELEKFQNKKVLLNNIKVVSIDHKKYYSTSSIPTLIK